MRSGARGKGSLVRHKRQRLVGVCGQLAVAVVLQGKLFAEGLPSGEEGNEHVSLAEPDQVDHAFFLDRVSIQVDGPEACVGESQCAADGHVLWAFDDQPRVEPIDDDIA